MKKFVSIMVMVMVMAAVLCGCDGKPFERDTKFEGSTPEVPADAVLTWRAIGDKDSVLVLVDGVAQFKALAPKFVAGNCYIKQGTQPLESNGCDVDTLQNSGKAVWNYNYNINDTIQYNLGISVVVMRYNFATSASEMSNETIYPEVPMGIFMSLEKSQPAEATGFYEINVMRYTLASLNNPSLYCGKAVSKATIYEIAHDTTVVHDTTIVNPPTPNRNWLYNDTLRTHVSVNPNGTYANYLVTWLHNHQYQIVEHWDADPFTVTHNPVSYNRYYPFSVTTTGQPTSAMIGTTVNVVNGVANFGGYTVTLTAQTPYSSVAGDVNCPFTLTTATMEADGPRVYAVSEGTTVNVKINANIPTPPPTTDTTIFGNIVYWSLTGTANAYSWTNVQWYINIITNDADGYHHRAALYTDGMSVSQLVWHDYGVMTTAEYNHVVSVSNFNTTNADGSSNAAQGIRRGLAVCKNSTAGANPGVSSTVKSDPNTGNNQVKYYSKSGSLIGACSAATGTIDGNNGGEPVRDGGVENHFHIGSQNVY